MRGINSSNMDRFLTVSTALIMVHFFVGVASFHLSPSALPLCSAPSRVKQLYSPTNQARSQPPALLIASAASGGRYQYTAKRFTSRHGSSGIVLRNRNNGDNNFDENNKNDSTNTGAASSVVDYVGLACQPVVWVSLYSVATTGGGLPAGPGGSIGALEGLSYLIVLVLALLPKSALSATHADGAGETTGDKDGGLFLNIQTLSRITIALGILILAGLAANRGCVPNAKPILDYSAYLPICSSE